MSTNKKNIKEMSSAAGSGMQGSSVTVKNAFRPADATVIKRKSAKERASGKDLKKNPNVTIAKLETKSERTLREAIRELVLLNRVKYHEQQALREMQEQKLRGVIRFLLQEADDSSKINYSSTGETSAASFMKKISVTMNEYAALVSTQAQRNEFKKIYLTGIKSYLDALDEQYYILNPEERPGSMPAPQSAGQMSPAPAGNQAATQAPAKRSDRLQEAAPSPISANKVNPLAGMDNKNMVAQAAATAVQIAGVSNKTGHGTAETALNRDLPQIDPLYNNLTFEEFNVNDAKGNSRTTNDRKDFRIMLIGDVQSGDIGNIANEFSKIDITKQTNDSPHKNDASKVPALEPKQQAAPPAEPAPAADMGAPPEEPTDMGGEEPPEAGV